jgi:hypothetical protein
MLSESQILLALKSLCASSNLAFDLGFEHLHSRGAQVQHAGYGFARSTALASLQLQTSNDRFQKQLANLSVINV